MKRPVCAKCGSNHITCDSYASWNDKEQDWELSSLRQTTYCWVCLDECHVRWEELYCDDCKNLNPKEGPEDRLTKCGHFCTVTGIQVFHGDKHPHLPRPGSCPGYEKEIE